MTDPGEYLGKKNKRVYSKNRCHNISEENKQKLGEHKSNRIHGRS